ncbi:MAG: hypothetical protein RL065_1898 [Bacteroidota bacterium]|jgi:phosphoesterase RecJ-like protein
MLNDTNIELIKQDLFSGKELKIVITTHHKPDGDALGSSLGLYHYLIQLNHQVQVISPTDYPYNLWWMPGNETVWEFEKTDTQSRELIANADLIFCLDFNHLDRINQMGELVRASKAKKVMIDHHLNPEGFEDAAYADTRAVATAELIYKFIAHLGDEDKINNASAQCLYSGILTDSGSFKFNSTTQEVHEIAGKLLSKGVKPFDVFEQIFDSNTENRLRFIGYCTNKKMIVLPEYNTAYISVTKEELKEYKITTGDTEGLVNYPLSIKGIKLAALIIDRTERVKLSLRSKGDIAVNELCSKYFNGGGHKNASGGHSTQTLEQTVETFLSILPTIKNQLN